MSNTIAINVLAETARARQGIDEVNGRLGRLEGAAGRAGKVLLAGLGGAAIIKGLGALKNGLAQSVEEGREAQKVGALTVNVIKQTGGAANVSAGYVGKLAESISNKTGIDDEAIQSGANLILTFKNVRNEAGKGNKVFDMATQAAIDLSASGFGSVESQSKALGVALNDPIKGISKLSKSGVTFSESQKAQIKGFVAQNDLLSAQKIILGEVNSQVGNSAAATATSGEKLKVVIGNIKERIGTALIPIIDRVGGYLAAKLPGWIDAGVEAFGRIRPVIGTVVGFFRNLSTGSGDAGGKFAQFSATVRTVWANVQTIFTSGVAIIDSLWSRFGGIITSYASGAFTAVLTIVRGAFTVLSGIFQTVSALLQGDWSGVWNGITTIVRGAWTIIGGVVAAGWNAIKTVFRLAGAAVAGIFGGIWDGIKNVAASGGTAVVNVVKSIPGKLRDIGSFFKSAGRSLIDAFVDGLQNAGGAIGGIAGSVWSAVKGLLNGAISKINAALEFRIAIPGAPDININPPNIPFLAKGGYVTKPTLAVIGEAGPEYVIPASKMGNVTPLKNAGGGRGGGNTYVIKVTAPVGASGADIGRELVTYIKAYEDQSGRPRR